MGTRKEYDMRKLIMAGLMATSLLPAAAQAQWIDRGEARELARDRADIREERRDLNRAYDYGDRRDIRDAREDYREARREYRKDYRDARRDYRGGDWGGGWRAPRGHYHSRHYINDWHRYGYSRPYGHQRWVRNGRDALLIDIRNGYVIRIHRNRFW
jgi:Ni/Co efflux regulator RcnB